ncbi:MAG: aminomethyl-transferring glycine dehydrogenase subunit GcvPB [Oscillospiraceae bacterium]|nr:aminomethyl-transferring glycine dehydrogenase subunit GcvPB [Oscillospiraceae bacterium]
MSYNKEYERIETGYHAVRWNEPPIYCLGRKGIYNEIAPYPAKTLIESVNKTVDQLIPENMKRDKKPYLPELSEPEVLRHYTRLSQNNFSYDSGSTLGLGTCTMKYSPKINDKLAGGPYISKLHPLQDDSTIQGILCLMYDLRNWLCELAGMDEFSFQPRGGAHGVFANASMMKAYHHSRGEDYRDEVITSVISHPVNAGCPAAVGYKVITLYPDPKTGDIGIEQMRAAISPRTAGMMVTIPYDTGVFDSHIKDYIDMVHEAGGLVSLDQANFNGVMGRLRAGDAGADMMHFNLHKSFSSPHGSIGPGSGAIGVKGFLTKFLPIPVVAFDGNNYYTDYERPDSIGKVTCFLGNIGSVIRTYAWIKALGANGLKEASSMAVINNNYLIKKMLQIPGVDIVCPHRAMLQEARFTVEKLFQDTGVTTTDVNRRVVDYGICSYFEGHEPMVDPNPITPEPSDSVTVDDLERFAEIIGHVSDEAYSDPEIVKTAPHRCAIHRALEGPLTETSQLATTWRAFLKRNPDFKPWKAL